MKVLVSLILVLTLIGTTLATPGFASKVVSFTPGFSPVPNMEHQRKPFQRFSFCSLSDDEFQELVDFVRNARLIDKRRVTC
jgi:hypothetical protein